MENAGRENENTEGRAGVRVGWMEAGMRVSVYEGWRSELWGTWWCPGWQLRWYYLRVCYRRKAEENRNERERGRQKRSERKSRQKETPAEREKEQARKMIRSEGEVLCKKTLEDKGV